MYRIFVRAGAVLSAVAITLNTFAPPVTAQGIPGIGQYLPYSSLTGVVKALAGAHPSLATLTSLAKTDAGRDIWLLRLANTQGQDPDTRPALLIVANLEANHLIGGVTALNTADQLLTGYAANADIKKLLDEHTIYIIPRANPDGAELAFTMPAYEIPYKPVNGNEAAGGLNIRELGADLNGDGFITQMRVMDPAGTMIPDPNEPRLMREANRARAERGRYKVMVEGIDPSNVDAFVSMGTDGVNLNRNFQHEYLYFQPHVGPHMASEVETRALVDFVYDRTNIAAVLTFSFFDNLRTAPPAQRQAATGVQGNPPNVPTNLLPADRAYFEFVSQKFTEMTSLRGTGADNEAGSFPQFVYYQMGLPSFTTPVWTVPPAPSGSQGAGAPSRDARWLTLFGSTINGYLNWTPAKHPTLGDVEVGGFLPNTRVNPPQSEVAALAKSHGDFATWLAQQLPKVEFTDTRVEAKGQGVFEVSTTLVNERYFPTQMAMGARIRFNRPITVRLMPADGMTVLSGNIQQQTPRIEGMGGRETYTWLVQAPAGTNVRIEAHAERAGGLLTSSVTLR
jgi:hypothetical protein